VAAADDDDVKLLGIKHGGHSIQGEEDDFTGAAKSGTLKTRA